MPVDVAPNALEAVSGFVHDVRSTLEDIQKIAEILNENRSCTIEVDNNTKLRLQVERRSTSHGKFADPLPQEHIDAEQANVYGAQSDGGSIWTGTEGSVTYMSDSFAPQPIRFILHFDNPYFGSNSAGAIRMGPGCDPLFTVAADAGAGNQHAPMRFTIAHNLGRFKIRSRASGKDLDVVGASHAEQMQIQQYDPNPGRNQQWRFAPVDGRYYHIFNEESAMVVDIAGSSHNTGPHVVQQHSLNALGNRDNQLWELIPQNTIQFAVFPIVVPIFVIKNKATGMVLDVPGTTNANSFVQQFNENQPDSGNQEWTLIPV
jgi:hypothetical protein